MNQFFIFFFKFCWIILLLFVFPILRYNDDAWAPWCLKSPTIRLCLQQLSQAKNNWNIKVPHYWPFVKGIQWPVDSSEKGLVKNTKRFFMLLYVFPVHCYRTVPQLFSHCTPIVLTISLLSEPDRDGAASRDRSPTDCTRSRNGWRRKMDGQ